ncbi:nitroreductase [Amylibacter sp. IMCC11727]|uniref:nitroreductase family protein n=1 Tax=Amylibacter sp. IMCC11727 TaxID=3039851 RepID=UPI00244DD725|nr:nitroreductase [Amylibacter sp. IMCC11727]WGI21135.1 nitroreductase [Amylibacter sp. IMCC11727]
MPRRNEDALNFLLERRSVSHKTLTAPVPSRAEIEVILTAGARVPDHKMLEPFRFLVLEDAALNRLGDAVADRARALGLDEDKVAKARFSFDNAPLSIAVVASLKQTDMIPEVEQTLAVGACCTSVLNAALASGWGANWITGWAAFDEPFLQDHLGLAAGEYVAGFMHIGTVRSEPSERKRPDLNAITTWVSS